jgi:caspase 7
MSHGDEGIVYGVDKAIEIDQLIQPFKQNRTLAGKPKIFIVQACRGSSFMEVKVNSFLADLTRFI